MEVPARPLAEGTFRDGASGQHKCKPEPRGGEVVDQMAGGVRSARFESHPKRDCVHPPGCGRRLFPIIGGADG